MSAPRDYELVRVSRELVERLVEDNSEPVVVMRLERLEDGTCELWLQNAPLVAEAERLREALREIAEQPASVPFGTPWKHWSTIAAEALEASSEPRP